MAKPIELKKGSIIEHKEVSYVILESYLNLEVATDWLKVQVKEVSCNKIDDEGNECRGNIMKLGGRKGQYRCLKCNSLVWMDSEGNLEEA